MDTQSIISPHKTTVEKLSTPFSPESSVVSAKSCIENLPASVVAREQSIRPARNLNLFLLTDLETWKIDRIYSHLWFAGGRLLRARSLHRYSVSRRQVVITENPSEHLVSDYSVIFIKPLPEYLLSHEFWDHHLSDDKSLHSAACGLLLSYTWLIAYKTDFNMARDLSLLPEGLTWDAWTRFANSFLDHLEASDTQLISQRYLYGELRMSRLNYIYKIIPALWSNDKPLRGFMPTSMWNKSFLERNVARLLGLFASF
ncbi:hypothetical protein FLONG3_563 [Fusarium longipes]|uniref:Uncharacterized protein n=1 Tax=Fusarium longipes TaxID=694270 RepID=A0A395T9Q4_9HYPO|nr:hypothetical protein FLONG3_563 [Fusarium longipes]